MIKRIQGAVKNFPSSSYGIAQGIRNGRIVLEKGTLLLENTPPCGFFTCSTAIRSLAEDMTRASVNVDAIGVVSLGIPIWAEKGRPERLEHVIGWGREGNHTYYFGFTPFDALLFGNLGLFHQEARTEDICTCFIQRSLRGRAILEEIEDPQQITLATNLLKGWHILGATTRGKTTDACCLGIAFSPRSVMVEYYATAYELFDALEPDCPLIIKKGEVGFAVEMNSKLCGNIKEWFAAHGTDYREFSSWLAAVHDFPHLYKEIICECYEEIAPRLIDTLTINLNVFYAFLKKLPPEIFLGEERTIQSVGSSVMPLIEIHETSDYRVYQQTRF